MFDIGWGELIVIGIVALIAIGPKELPGALRALGQWTSKIRRMASDFQNQFHEAMREAEMADLKKQVDTLTSGFDPVETVRREIESAVEDKPPSALAAPSAPPSGGAETPSVETPSAYAPSADARSADAPSADAPADPTVAPDVQAPPEPTTHTEADKAFALDEPGAAKPSAAKPSAAKPGERPT
jgi:sec-independent protein translocase protein TatB